MWIAQFLLLEKGGRRFIDGMHDYCLDFAWRLWLLSCCVQQLDAFCVLLRLCLVVKGFFKLKFPTDLSLDKILKAPYEIFQERQGQRNCQTWGAVKPHTSHVWQANKALEFDKPPLSRHRSAWVIPGRCLLSGPFYKDFGWPPSPLHSGSR